MVMPVRTNAAMDAPPEVTVGDVMEVVAATMKQEQGRLDGLSSFGGDGTHGTRMARAWQDVAYATLGSGTGDTGEDLELAGEVLGSPEYGRAANILGKGMYAAGAGLVGRRTWSLADVGPVLQAMADAAQQDDEYQLGDGTLLDALVPAAVAYNNAIAAGLTYLQAIQGSLGAAMNGVRRTADMAQGHNPNLKPGAPRQPDPGAASTQVFLTGLLQGLLGVRLPPLPTGADSSNALINFLQQGIDVGGFVARPPVRRPVESLLGDTDRAGRYGQDLATRDPGYGKGTDVGPQ